MNCSARLNAPLRALIRYVVYGMSALLISATATATAAGAGSLEEFDDAAGRVQYAYYTADARALEEVLQLIERFESDASLAAMKSYSLAYGHWRLAQVLAADAAAGTLSGARTTRVQAAQACARHAEAAIAAASLAAEAYAIHAVCEKFSPAGQHKTACRGKWLRTALSLAADNPRVRLIEALCKVSPDIDSLRKIVAAFEAASPRTRGKPDWGYAEALMLLGDSYLQHGDPLAARDALERVLVIAPDYRQAQTLLQIAATRAR